MAAVKDYPVHPLAQIFPEMSDEDYRDFKASIERAGQIFEPITLLDGEILDGRHRHRVARELRIPCPTANYSGKKDITTLTTWVKAKNVDRRHMSTSQRQACAAAYSLYLQQGGDDEGDETAPPKMSAKEAVTVAAETWGVGTRGVEAGRQVMRESPKQFEQVRDGKITMNEATEVVREKRDETLGAASEKTKKASPPPTDAVGVELPKGFAAIFDSLAIPELASTIREARNGLKKLKGTQLGAYIHNQTDNDLKNVAEAIEFAKPYAMCPYCYNAGSKGCKPCRKAGWMNKDTYDSVPKSERIKP